MVQVLCPVCGEPLQTENAVWHCPGGHSFDVARQGYVNLLTVEQKHSRQPGDSKTMVAARREFLDSGIYQPIADTLCRIVAREKPASILDVGCGEGYYLGCLKKFLPGSERWGLDISKEAVRRAAARDKTARWLTATAVRLPFPAESFDCLISMFALTAEQEYARVLRPGGSFVQVIAGENHLMALKNLIYPEIIKKDKVLHPELDGFSLVESETLCFSFTLTGNRQIENLLSMTPHFMRITKEGADRAAAAETLTDEAEVVFNLYRKK